jgi:hypothetical protein
MEARMKKMILVLLLGLNAHCFAQIIGITTSVDYYVPIYFMGSKVFEDNVNLVDSLQIGISQIYSRNIDNITSFGITSIGDTSFIFQDDLLFSKSFYDPLAFYLGISAMYGFQFFQRWEEIAFYPEKYFFDIGPVFGIHFHKNKHWGFCIVSHQYILGVLTVPAKYKHFLPNLGVNFSYYINGTSEE